MKTPACVLNSRDCKVKTLTLSNEHATILVTTTTTTTAAAAASSSTSSSTQQEQQDEQEQQVEVEHSLLKLTVVPFHHDIFHQSSSVGQQQDQDDVDDDSTSKILSFLSGYDFQLTSESGAEYSYYNAVPKRNSLAAFLSRWIPGGIRQTMTTTRSDDDNKVGAFRVEFISPASPRQIQRAMPKPSMAMIYETPALYTNVTRPYIQTIVDSGSLSWIDNVVSGKKEQERLLLDSDDYILNVDTKWISHPDPHVVRRSEWYNHDCIGDLYCLAIVKDGNSIASLRDLRARHLSVLRSILNDCPTAIEGIYGVPRHQLRVFVHYQPQFYHFHVHFTRLENDIGCQVERGHLLSDIIQNLEMDDEFYAKRTITYKLAVNDKLYGLLKEAQAGEGGTS